MFWNRLMEYGILIKETEYEDESLLSQGLGITDIVKVPRSYGNEPSEAEYRQGLERILSLIQVHQPAIIVFVYKRVLDSILKLGFEIKKKSVYGFNPELENLIGAQVFVFPMPGTRCTREQAQVSMRQLAKTASEK